MYRGVSVFITTAIEKHTGITQIKLKSCFIDYLSHILLRFLNKFFTSDAIFLPYF
jgi:hypothetical protein